MGFSSMRTYLSSVPSLASLSPFLVVKSSPTLSSVLDDSLRTWPAALWDMAARSRWHRDNLLCRSRRSQQFLGCFLHAGGGPGIGCRCAKLSTPCKRIQPASRSEAQRVGLVLCMELGFTTVLKFLQVWELETYSFSKGIFNSAGWVAAMRSRSAGI